MSIQKIQKNYCNAQNLFPQGFQMLQKLGWTEGQGLGIDGGGIINPINKYALRIVHATKGIIF